MICRFAAKIDAVFPLIVLQMFCNRSQTTLLKTKTMVVKPLFVSCL
jgi:hypothetical protein